MPFERIVMHAISRDAATGARPCIFAQVERPAAAHADNGDGADEDADAAAGGNGDAGEEDDEELLGCTELRLVPQDETACACPCAQRAGIDLFLQADACAAVNSLFRTMCDVAALNPDPREDGAGGHHRLSVYLNPDQTRHLQMMATVTCTSTRMRPQLQQQRSACTVR